MGRLAYNVLRVTGRGCRGELSVEKCRRFERISSDFGHVTRGLARCHSDALTSVLSTGGFLRTIIGDVRRPVVNLGARQRVLFVGGRTLGMLGVGHRGMVQGSTRRLSLGGSLLHELVHRLIAPNRGGRPLGVCTSGGRDCFRTSCVPVRGTTTRRKRTQGLKSIVLLGGVARFGRLSSTGAAFVSAVSRRLGAPVSTVVVDLRLLRSGEINSLGNRRRRLSGGVESGDRHLLSVAKRLLGVARIRTNGLRVVPGVAGPVRLVRCTVGTGRMRTSGFGVRVRISCPRRGVPGLFMSDRGVT